MALTINTNIINDADNYSLDAKQVKGGFGVVAKQTDLAGLPNATIVKGSLYYATDQDKFYQYNGTAWVEKQFGGGDVKDVQVNGTTVLDTTTKVANIPLAASDKDGAMSKADKSKLDAFAINSLGFDAEKNILIINGKKFLLTPCEVDVFICGGLFKTEEEFAAMTVEELLDTETVPVVLEKSIYEAAGTILDTTWGNETNSIYYILVKDGLKPVLGSMTCDGITSPFVESDFTNSAIWRATHADVTVEDLTYHVYGYRTRFTANTKMNVVIQQVETV